MIEGGPVANPYRPPIIELDGVPQPNVPRYGQVTFEVPAGQHQLTIYTARGNISYGLSRLAVEVPAGGGVQVYYRPFTSAFSPGALGMEPHSQAGSTILWVIVIALLVVSVPLILGVLL